MTPYIKEGGGGAAGPLGVRLEESYSHREEDSPLLPWWRRKGGRGKWKGGRPPFLVLFGLGGEGACVLPWPALLFSLMAH